MKAIKYDLYTMSVKSSFLDIKKVVWQSNLTNF